MKTFDNKLVKIACVIALCYPTVKIQAQTYTDALRYSQTIFGGSARYNSMAGSMGALGGDISTMANNPAGIGVYKKSEFSLSPSLYFATTNSDFKGSSSLDSKINFNFGHIGFVASKELQNNVNGWNNFNWGMAYNRQNNFNRNTYIQGFNSSSSLIDDFLNRANGTDTNSLDPYTTDLAYQTYLIDHKPGASSDYYALKATKGMNQSKYVSTSGASSEINLVFSGNWQDKLYVGSSINITKIKYKEYSEHNESKLASDTIFSIKSFSYVENLTTEGAGVNLKLGAIYRLTDAIRIGGAVHTPTYYDMHDKYSSQMSTKFDKGYHYDYSSPAGSYDYTLITPAKLIGSLGLVLGKKGLLNADYEYINYKTAQFLPGKSFKTVNSDIQKKGTSASNLKVGAELRFDPFVVRAGFALYGNAFQQNLSVGSYKQFYTFGFGYRKDSFFLDFAYVFTNYKTNYYLYNPQIVTAAVNTNTASSFVTTIGFKF